MFAEGNRIHALGRRCKHGVFSMAEARSWQVASPTVLRVVLSRLAKKGAIVRLARGLYYAPPVEQPNVPIDDVRYAAQLAFGGYLAFATALYLHRLRDEVPYAVLVATHGKSALRQWGAVEVRAVALRDRAVGIQRLGDYTVSTRAKTLYDCLHLPELGGGEAALAGAFRKARLSPTEVREFKRYVNRFESGNARFHARLHRVIKLARR